MYQVKVRSYDSLNRYWTFGNLEKEFIKKYEKMVFYCLSDNGKIERKYIFPSSEIIGRTTITITKYRTSGLLYKRGWYEKYRINDEEELKKVNNILQNILEKE